MAPDPAPERTPLGMRLAWLLVPAALFGLYFWWLLQSGAETGAKASTEATEDQSPFHTR